MDTATQQTAISQASRGVLRAGLWIGALLCLFAAPVQADRIVEIRVGNHPTFTRLVFEMDTAVGYQIERQTAEDGSKQITVTVNASSHSREIQSKSVGIESVTVVEAVDTSIAQIRLRRSDVLMKEMILSNPPRIVLDFEFEPEVAATPKATPKASPAPSTEAKSTPSVIAEAPPQTPISTPVPEVVKVEPAEPVAHATVEEKERVVLQKPVPGIEEREMPTAEPVRRAAPELERRPIERAPDSIAESDAAQVDAADRLKNIGQTLKAETAARAITPTPTPQTKPAELAAPRRVAKSGATSSKSSVNPYVIAGAAIGLLVVAVLAVRMYRKRPIPTDADLALPAFDDDVFDASPAIDNEESVAAEEESDGSRIPAEGFAMNDEPSADDDSAQVFEENTAAYSLSEVASQTTEPETGFFNEDSEGEKIMDLDATDLPADREELSTPPMAVATDDTDIAALVQGLASRIEGLESRLDESNEARERLERQVAAQSEELRVQRAAIARTQRALRSLSRTEEDQATEPALREPSNPTS